MMKKAICITMIISILTVFLLPAEIFAAALEVQVKFDFKEKEMVVYGNVGSSNKNVSVIITNKTNAQPVLVTQKKSESDGSYTFTKAFDDLTKGNYEICVSAETMAQPQSTQIYYDPALVSDNDEIPQSTGSNSSGGPSGGGKLTVITPPVQAVPELPKSTTNFSDVADNHWAKDAIYKLANKEIINGVGNGLFAPEKIISREEFAKMIIAVFGLAIVEGDIDFADVEIDQWYYPYVVSVYKYGIMNGFSDTQLGIGQNITRQDACAMILRALDIKDAKLSVDNKSAFADDIQIDEYAKKAVYALYNGGIVSGMEEGKFYPDNNLTRAMAALILGKILDVKGVSK